MSTQEITRQELTTDHEATEHVEAEIAVNAVGRVSRARGLRGRLARFITRGKNQPAPIDTLPEAKAARAVPVDANAARLEAFRRVQAQTPQQADASPAESDSNRPALARRKPLIEAPAASQEQADIHPLDLQANTSDEPMDALNRNVPIEVSPDEPTPMGDAIWGKTDPEKATATYSELRTEHGYVDTQAPLPPEPAEWSEGIPELDPNLPVESNPIHDQLQRETPPNLHIVK